MMVLGGTFLLEILALPPVIKKIKVTERLINDQSKAIGLCS